MSYPQYSSGWHQCRECGTTRADKALRQLKLSDPVLNLDSFVYQCTDAEVCARMKKHRDDEQLGATAIDPDLRRKGVR